MIDFGSSDEEKYIDRIDTSRPLTRDLSEIVKAAYIIEAELRHQVGRLQNVQPRTEAEAEHTQHLREGYNNAYYNVRVLRRYHEGRLHRLRTTGDTAPQPDEPDESESGPVFSEAHDDPHGANNG